MPLSKDTLPYGDKNRSPFYKQPESEYPETLRSDAEKDKRQKVAEKTEQLVKVMDAYTRGEMTEDQMEEALKNIGVEGLKEPDHAVELYNTRIEEIEENELMGEVLKDTAKEIAFYQFLQKRGARGIDEMRDDIINDLANNKNIRSSLKALIAAGVDEAHAVDNLIENLITDLGVSDKNITMVAAAVRRSYNTLKSAA